MQKRDDETQNIPIGLRDYIASAAMAAIIIGNGADECTIDNIGAALDAYKVADAMLEARDVERK